VFAQQQQGAAPDASPKGTIIGRRKAARLSPLHFSVAFVEPLVSSRSDVVLVNPGSRVRIYQALGKKLTAVENPVWAGLIATFIRTNGYSVEIVDAEADNLTPEQTAERVQALDPRLVVIVVYGHQPSASTQNMAGASAICTALKNTAPELKVLMVGGHVAALPERTLSEERCDFVAKDEGLHAVPALIEALKAGGDPVSLGKVPGLVYRRDAMPWSNPAAPLVKNLDQELPGIAWDLLPVHKYRAHNWHCFGHLVREPYAAIYTTLGCPYHCGFCCIQAPFKNGEQAIGLNESVNSYRYWSPKLVVDQIGVLVERYGVRNIKIADEMFVLNPRHVLGVCDVIIERRYDLNIWAYARVDTVKDHMIEKLKHAGVNWLAFGIEAANQRVLGDISKRFTEDQVYTTVRAVQAAGINVIGNFIFGLPEDDLASMQETLDLAMDLNCEFANFYCAMAYPGSPLYHKAVARGWALPATWSGYSQHAVDTLPLPTNYLPAPAVLRFRDEAFHRYFTNPAYISMIERKFGPETVAHIREMSSHKLERAYA
jgi:anaerobic magnesium-protoporphyrin IX monomethyl ester cyclase